MATNLPEIQHIIETILYVKSLERTKAFYKDIFGAKEMLSGSDRGIGFEFGNTNLLCFVLGKTTADLVDDPSNPELRIPQHGPSEHLIEVLMDDSKAPTAAKTNSLRQHYCFAVNTKADVAAWERHLIDNSVSITGHMNWERGGCSVYFEDPDGHVGEIMSRGNWPNWQ